MRYLKPRNSIVKINDKEHNLIFSLDVIDQIQDKTQLPMLEIIMMLYEDKMKKKAAEVLIKYLTGKMIEIEDDKLDYYSIALLNAYIEQLKSKEIPGLKKIPVDDKNYEFIDIEHWIYIGTVVLQRPEEEVWGMTLGKIKTLYNEHAKYNGWIKEEKEESLLNL